MPLLKTDTRNPIRRALDPTTRQRTDCQNVIKQIKFGDLSRGAGTLYTSGSARLDMQGRTSAGDANIQAQVGNNSTAAVIVRETSLRTQDSANQRGVAKAVISALNQSLDSGMIYNVSGNVENR